MSKKVIKIIVIVLLAIITMGVILAIVVFAFLSHLFSSLPDSEAARKRVDSSYQKISLPQQLSFIEKTPTGDPIDSPDNFGWTYVYSVDGEPTAFKDPVLLSMKNAGYTEISDDNASESTMNKENLNFTVSNTNENVTIHVDFRPTKIRIYATEMIPKDNNE